VQPVEIRKRPGGAGMKITWDDGHVSEYPAAHLRRFCRCATCHHELTGERLLDPASVPEELTIVKADLVGNYAIGFEFSDKHSTGIYSFDWLRRICPCCGKVSENV
jgi:DUF971 family protein